jgi:hypothetical protein|tara:strand:+ start:235 stop:420 length:186 start_codon:yes stop_codon:yes gene_type:complete
MNVMNEEVYRSVKGINSDVNTFFYVCGNRYDRGCYDECRVVYEGMRYVLFDLNFIYGKVFY